MSEFSDVLSSLIKDKNADTPEMAKYCGFDRSTLYKVLKGKRNPPSLETVLKIGRFLRFTHQELQLLTKAWQITVLRLKKVLPPEKCRAFSSVLS